MTDSLLPTRFLFHFSAPCRYHKPLWTDKGANLDETHRLVSLAELEERAAWAEVRAAWNETGLAFSVCVTGKRQPPWCRAARPEDSDGLQLWIDTRDVHNVHRAGRFCHRFIFLPDGGVAGTGPVQVKPGVSRKLLAGRAAKVDLSAFTPSAEWLAINRAREQPTPVRPGALQARSQQRPDGYILEVMIPADALTGFDPAEHPSLGFTYAVIDRELGEQTFGVGSPMPYQEDPGLWATLELKGKDEG